MYNISYTNKFKKSLKKCKKRGLDIDLAKTVITKLAVNGVLPEEYSPHKLKGDYDGLWECHIKPDWLLVWKQDDKELTLLMTDTGTHADLF